MKTRRSFLKVAAAGSLAAGISASFIPESLALTNGTPIRDLTSNLPDITTEDYVYRLNQARKWLEKFDMDAVFVEGGVNMNYFTGTDWWMSERLFGFVLGKNSEPVWICPSFELKRAKEVVRFGTDIRTWEEHESPFALLSGIMKDIGSQSGSLGVGPNVRNFIVEGIRRDTRIRLVNGAPVTENTRAVKSEKELKYMDVANRITKLAYQEAFRQAKEGMSQDEFSAIVRSEHTKMGATGGGYPLFATASAFPHGTKEKKPLQEGDIILLDGGCSVKGFRSDVTRTIVFGQPSPRQREVFEVVLNAQRSAFEVIKKGLPCQEADAAARKVVEKAGFGSDYQNFTHRLGHGIGMEVHEYPYLVRGNELKMMPGMTFTNEPGIYLYGEFGVRIEDSFYATEDGYKIFGDMECLSLETPFKQ